MHIPVLNDLKIYIKHSPTVEVEWDHYLFKELVSLIFFKLRISFAQVMLSTTSLSL